MCLKPIVGPNLPPTVSQHVLHSGEGKEVFVCAGTYTQYFLTNALPSVKFLYCNSQNTKHCFHLPHYANYCKSRNTTLPVFSWKISPPLFSFVNVRWEETVADAWDAMFLMPVFWIPPRLLPALTSTLLDTGLFEEPVMLDWRKNTTNYKKLLFLQPEVKIQDNILSF